MKPEKRPKRTEERPLEPGTGARCPEAQADGVPCPTLGRSCAVCERALSVDDEAPAIRPPGRD